MENSYTKSLKITQSVPNIQHIKVSELSIDKKTLFLGGSLSEQNKFQDLPVLVVDISNFKIKGKRINYTGKLYCLYIWMCIFMCVLKKISFVFIYTPLHMYIQRKR